MYVLKDLIALGDNKIFPCQMTSDNKVQLQVICDENQPILPYNYLLRVDRDRQPGKAVHIGEG